MLAIKDKDGDTVRATISPTAAGWYKLPNGDHVALPLPPDFQHALYKIEAATLSKDDLKAQLAALRFAREIGGIIISGAPIATDDRSKLMLAAARIRAKEDPEFTTGWKTDAGWLPLTAAEIIVIADAVLDHVHNCFAAEALVAADIEDGKLTAADAVREAFSGLID